MGRSKGIIFLFVSVLLLSVVSFRLIYATVKNDSPLETIRMSRLAQMNASAVTTELDVHLARARACVSPCKMSVV